MAVFTLAFKRYLCNHLCAVIDSPATDWGATCDLAGARVKQTNVKL